MRQRLFLASGLGLGLAAAAIYFPGCSAGTEDDLGLGASAPTTVTATGAGGNASASESVANSSSTGFIMPDGGPDAPPDVMVNPCGTECPDPPGSVPDKCDGIFRGLDDNCNGTVDEDCPCTPGEASSCFKGDPSYRDDEGCAPGTEICNEVGQWGECVGGQHATEQCYLNGSTGCHAINALPFETVHLENGAGTFDDNADPGSEVWELTCPMGVMPCPVPTPTAGGADVQVIVSGEYTVTYTKTVGGQTETCSFPLYVGARGLRVELTWNYPNLANSVDLDLHMHQPGNTQPWSMDTPTTQDCMYSNCYINKASPGTYAPPEWFPMAAPLGDPVAWYKDPLLQANTCYFAPRGFGAAWQSLDRGCHNPRLDLDNVVCNPAVSNTEDEDFCAPENINVDFPPKNEWIRVGVYGYSVATSGIRPTIRIYCDGTLAAELGPQGFNGPVTMPVDDPFSFQHTFWSVADVAFKEDECAATQCVVKPHYLNNDEVAKVPLMQPVDLFLGELQFNPPYPPPP